MHTTQSQVTITSVLLHIRKPRLGFDQGPVTGAMTSLSWLNLAEAPAHIGFIRPASSLPLSHSFCLPLCLLGGAHVSGHLPEDALGQLSKWMTTDESFYQTLMKKLFCVRPCLKPSPTKAVSRCQHYSFPHHGQHCPQVSAARSGRGSRQRGSPVPPPVPELGPSCESLEGAVGVHLCVGVRVRFRGRVCVCVV